MKKDLSIHIVRCNTTYWYAEVKAWPGVRLEGRGGFDSEAEARAWAQRLVATQPVTTGDRA